MIEIIQANLGTIFVLAVLIFVIFMIILKMRKDKNNGKSAIGCGSNCASCGKSCSH